MLGEQYNVALPASDDYRDIGSRPDGGTGGGAALPGPTVPVLGPVVSGLWYKIPSIFRLRLTGTGTVVMDSKDSLGNISSAVASYSPSAATDQIEFPYAGDNAVAIRITLTDTATAEVI